jgi:hypothetical protein
MCATFSDYSTPLARMIDKCFFIPFENWLKGGYRQYRNVQTYLHIYLEYIP